MCERDYCQFLKIITHRVEEVCKLVSAGISFPVALKKGSHFGRQRGKCLGLLSAISIPWVVSARQLYFYSGLFRFPVRSVSAARVP